MIVTMGCALSAGCTRHQEQEHEATGSAGAERYGSLMFEVGQRYELLGRAASAKRWELAAFELHELEETFEELPAAKQPDNPDHVDLRGLEEAFENTHPPKLRSALKAKDGSAFSKAFKDTAGTCNACHDATGHGFVEIPGEPGATVPKLDPVP
jgi:hypothetical protein